MKQWLLLIGLLAFSGLLSAVTKEVPAEALKPGKSQRQTALIVNRVLQKYQSCYFGWEFDWGKGGSTRD